MYCTKCGKQIQNKATFCSYCGEPILIKVENCHPEEQGKNIPGDNPVKTTASAGQGKNKGPVGLLIGAAMIACLAIGLLIGKGSGSKEPIADVPKTKIETHVETKAETEVAAYTETAAEPETTVEAKTPETEAKESEALPVEATLSSNTCTCMNGNVTVSAVSYDKSNSSITLRIENNMGQEISTFGFPTIVIDGQSIELDPFSNMNANLASIAANSYAEITYYVDSRLLESGGQITGQLWIMDPTVQDKTYTITIGTESI